jgi:cell division septum initiation protein DivIVA
MLLEILTNYQLGLGKKLMPSDHLLSLDSNRQATPGGIIVNRVDTFMNLHRQIDQLEEMILESTPRFMGRTWVDEEKLCQQIDQVRLALPDSISKAEELLQNRQTIVTEAERHAEELVENAKRKAQMYLDESMLMRQAEQEANQLRRHTQEECDQLRREILEEVNQLRRQAQKELEANHQKVRLEAENLKVGADQYCDQSLITLETQLIDMLKVVQNGRRELRKPGG